MTNHTNIRIPKKYHHMIREIYKDSDGYWVLLNPGYIDPDMGTHGFHELRVCDVLSAIKTIEKEVSKNEN